MQENKLLQIKKHTKSRIYIWFRHAVYLINIPLIEIQFISFVSYFICSFVML